MHIHEKARVPVLRRALDNIFPARQVHIEEDIHESEEDDAENDRGVGWSGAMGLAGILSAGGLYAWWLNSSKPGSKKPQSKTTDPKPPADIVLSPAAAATAAPAAADGKHPITDGAPEYLSLYFKLFRKEYPQKAWSAMGVDTKGITVDKIDQMLKTAIPDVNKYKNTKGGDSDWIANAKFIVRLIKTIKRHIENSKNNTSDDNILAILNIEKDPAFFGNLHKDDTAQLPEITHDAGTNPIPWQKMCIAALLFYLERNLAQTQKKENENLFTEDYTLEI